MKKILAIETSCDDTSVGIVRLEDNHFYVDALHTYTQIIHKQYGGVVPELASRKHAEKIIAVLDHIGWDAIQEVDAIAVTTTPGLPGSLVIGKTTAQFLGAWFKKPVLPVNHIYGHIFSVLLERDISVLQFPYVVLTASGGHNDIYVVSDSVLESDIYDVVQCGQYSLMKIWWTRDDASWECFDKVSRMLGGPYPWGAWIGQQAEKWKKNDLVSFRHTFLDRDSYEFSFSWMKSQVHNLLEKFAREWVNVDEQMTADIAYAFQEAVVHMLGKKLLQAVQELDARTVWVVGWVSANTRLWEYIQALWKKDVWDAVAFYKPTKHIYSTDNAAMIGVVGLLEE